MHQKYKKILLCTIVDDWHNYGQRLQAYALCKFINDNFDVECKLCDYRANPEETSSFREFQRHFIPSLHARNVKDIYEFDPDAILLGSDQILNNNIIDLRSYCFGILKVFKNISTYAAGETGWNPVKNTPNILMQNDKNRFALKMLKRCEAISIREDVSAKRISSLLADRPVSCNIDPVFLLTTDDWRSLERKPSGIEAGEVFDFVY